MSLALGVLKWTPETFWAATLVEFDAAMLGHMESLGVDPDDGPPSQDDLDWLKENFGHGRQG